MKRMSIMILFLLSLSSFAHCPIDLGETNLCADITWVDGPYANDTSHFQMLFWKRGDAEHRLVSPDYHLDIYSWMIMDNGMNHGGPAMNAYEIEEGLFDIQNARFFTHGMNGHWEIRVKLSDDQGEVIVGSQRVPLSSDGNGHGGGHQH